MLQILLILPFAVPAASQCMIIKKQSRTAGYREGHLMANSRLVDCIDDCLTNNKHNCKMLVFNHVQKTCRIVHGYRTTPCEGCLVLEKMSCKSIVDFHCFPPVAYGNEGLHYIYGIESGEECRRICIIITNCRAYTWWTGNNRCGIRKHNIMNMKQLENGEVSYEKKPTCNSNRCTTLLFNVYGNHGRIDKSVKTMIECYNKMVDNTKIRMVDWDFEIHQCSIYRTRYPSVYLSNLNIIRSIRTLTCEDKKPDVCAKKNPNSAMEGGFLITSISEQDCVSLCLNTVNCAAVTWSRAPDTSCRFHHVIRKITERKHTVNYVVVNCGSTDRLSNKDEKPISNMLSTYYTYQGSIPNKSSPSCFTCALQCQMKSCSSFRCFSKGQGQIDPCVFSDDIKNSFVPMN